MAVEIGSKALSTMAKSVPKVAWIVGVGAAAGLGAALARRFASAGLVVALTGRTAERVRAAAAQIVADGGRASAIPGDVSSVEDIRQPGSGATNTAGRVRRVHHRIARLDSQRRHSLYWYLRQTSSEATLLKIYESATDGRARLTAHTAFDDPTSAPDAPPRRSIEGRSIVFW